MKSVIDCVVVCANATLKNIIDRVMMLRSPKTKEHSKIINKVFSFKKRIDIWYFHKPTWEINS